MLLSANPVFSTTSLMRIARRVGEVTVLIASLLDGDATMMHHGAR
jgi:hypothetical protein